MPAIDRSAWARVGPMLADRRVQINARYKNRRLFAIERMGSVSKWRTLHDAEQAKRDGFRPETVRAFEAAYELVPGSLDRTLAGGDLEPQPQLPPVLVPPELVSGSGTIPDNEVDRTFLNAVVLLAAQEHKGADVRLREIWALMRQWPGAEESPSARESA